MNGSEEERPPGQAGHVRIPGYRDLVPIGRGGYSRVYRAYQERFDREVALKILHFEIEDEAAQGRFRRECQVMGRLGDHPYIVTVYDADVAPQGQPMPITDVYDAS